MRATVSNPFASTAEGRSDARGDERADRDPVRLGGHRPHHREQLERRAPSAVRCATEQVVVREHTVEPGCLRGRSHRERGRGVIAERRKRQPQMNHSGRVIRVESPGSGIDGAREHRRPDEPGFLTERGRDDLDRCAVRGAFDVPLEPLPERIEQHPTELDEAP